MKPSSLSFLGLLAVQVVLANGYELKAEAGASPTSKVIELLEEMEEKGTEDMQKEKLQYTEYQAWCTSTKADKERSIKDSASKLEILKADTAKLKADIDALADELPKLSENIEKWKKEKADATKEREEGRDDYAKSHGDYTKAISSIGKARDKIKEQDTEKKTAKEAFLQLSSVTAPLDARASIEAFIAESSVVNEAASADADPEKEEAGYKFKSGMIIDLMDKLLDKFKTERHTLEKEEIEAKGLYERLMQEKGASIETAEKSLQDKTAEKAKKVQTKAEKTAEVGQIEKLQKDDTSFLEDLVENCKKKGETFKQRQKMRSEEIVAIEEATKILKDKLKPVSEKSFLQLKSKAGLSLASLRSDSRGIVKERAVSLLRERAEELNSHVLSALALRAAGDPLAKVRKMISEMITRMQEDSVADAEKDGWCKKELGTNEQTRTTKQQAVEALRGEMSKLSTDIEDLGEDIADLAKDTAKLTEDMGEATKLRNKEKEENEETIKDAKAAQEAVAQAVVALNAFYGKVEKKESLLQQGAEEDQKPPKTFEGDYTGMESGGITSILEIIQSDFAKSQTETEAEEEENDAKYKKFMGDAKADEAAKKKESELKTSTKTKKEGKLTNSKVDLHATEKALAGANKYYEDLKPQCINIGPTREEKIAARKEEIKSMKQVLEILEGA